jgi:hypothetical protein
MGIIREKHKYIPELGFFVTGEGLVFDAGLQSVE